MIADPSALSDLLHRAAGQPRIALDTEADSLHSYFEKLCLIQLSMQGEHVLIDPLAGLDLQPFFDVLAPKRVVFHGCDYDMRLLNRAFRIGFKDLFDTMIAARLCGFKELGLAALVERFFHVKLSKASQKANWALRPLSAQMIEYAKNDTRYLLDLEQILEAELSRLGRREWFAQSLHRMVEAARQARPRDESVAWRITGSAALSPRAQSILRVLWQWRDTEARAWDRPPFHVMGNNDLLRLSDKAAADQPISLPRMSSRRRRSFDVVLALALQIPESEWPRVEKKPRVRIPREQMNRLDQLRKIRDQAAADLHLDPSIVAPRQALESAAENPQTDALMPWQKQILGMSTTGNGSVPQAA